MSERAAAEVGVDGRRVRFEEPVHSMEHDTRWFAVKQLDGGVSEALHKLIEGGGRHVGGEELINLGPVAPAEMTGIAPGLGGEMTRVIERVA